MNFSPINRRRVERFKANKRGWWSLWLFLGLFILSLGAELIANDKPLLVEYQGDWYFPVLKRYPETVFGGEFHLEANYKSPYIRELIEAKQGWMLWPPIPFSYSSINYDLKIPAPAPPSSANWFGTDDQGRDVLARLIYGFRISVLFALILTLASSVIGVLAGALQGFYGGWVDLIGQRFLEVWSGLPVLYLLIILASFVQPNFWWLLGIMLLFSWMSLVDVVRAEFLRGRNLEYVRAARALGMQNSAIMYRHILPNAMISTMTFMPFILTGAIGTLTALANPARPMLAIVAGSKVSTKLDVLTSLSEKCDQLIVGGGIANTFLAAAGFKVGKSLCEKDLLDTAKAIAAKVSVPLPTDVVVAEVTGPIEDFMAFVSNAKAVVKKVQDVGDNDMILDVGPQTAKAFADIIKSAKTILWNGPVGVFEVDQFGEGTKVLAHAVADSAAFSIAGGGDTLAAVDKYGVADKVSYISTGGGAFLEYVEGKTLPAVAMLQSRAK